MLKQLFDADKPVIGVVHLLPLPGSPRYAGDLEAVLLRAEQEATSLASGGAHGIIIENFFDTPFTKSRVDTATACAMTLAVKRIATICDLPIGVNVLRNDGMTALAIAATAGAQFIRVNVLSGAMVTDQGLIEGEAHELHMYRRMLSAQGSVRILADVMVKHASPLGQNSDIAQAAKDTVLRGLADGVIVSGPATGSPPNWDDLSKVREALPTTPILIGSGTTVDNCAGLLAVANGLIVASSLKRQGLVENPIDVERVRALVKAVQSAHKEEVPS
jgi:uncharacterized protein